MRSKSQILSKLRADGHITDEEYKALEQEPTDDATLKDIFCMGCEYKEQEPKTGHWIYKQYGSYPECGDYHCSQCDEIDNRTPAYCSHCGCCMFEPQERSE